MPGYLIPADLERLIPPDSDPFKWAESNLLASPGAKAMRDGEIFRIPTLVPAKKPDGSCINLTADGACAIHENAPFGCAFFSCQQNPPGVMERSLILIMKAWQNHELYFHLWVHLSYKGLEQTAPEVLREQMR